MKIEDIVKLIEAVSKNGLTSFYYEEGNAVLNIKKKEAPVVVTQQVQTIEAPMQNYTTAKDSGVVAVAQTQEIESENVIASPLVGTFYSASSPEAAPFVQVGTVVKKGQVLGIIEAMKLMNEIESDVDGVVEAILVKNEDVVEYGQPLFRIK